MFLFYWRYLCLLCVSPMFSARLGWNVSPLFQDADCIFLNKEELEVKVDLLRRQLELLKCVFEEVSFSGLSQEFGGAVSSLRCSEFLQLETPL